jgi:hypothetical protein
VPELRQHERVFVMSKVGSRRKAVGSETTAGARIAEGIRIRLRTESKFWERSCVNVARVLCNSAVSTTQMWGMRA